MTRSFSQRSCSDQYLSSVFFNIGTRAALLHAKTNAHVPGSPKVRLNTGNRFVCLLCEECEASEYVGKLERRLHLGTSKYSSTQAQGKQARALKLSVEVCRGLCPYFTNRNGIVIQPFVQLTLPFSVS